MLFLCAPGVEAQQTPAPAPSPTPAREEIPYNENPNVPGLSREERIRRQEAYIRKRIAENQGKKKEEQQQKLEEAQAKIAEARKAQEQAVQAQTQGQKPAPGLPPGAKAPGGPAAQTLARPRPGTEPEASGGQKIDIRAPGQQGEGPLENALPQMAFYLYPGAVTIEKGQIFSTETHLLNLQGGQADRIELVLSYPPDFLEPVAIHQDAIKGLLAEPPQWGVNKDAGVIRYRAQFREPVATLDLRGIEVVWRAARATEEATISLAAGSALSGAWMGPLLLTRNSFGDSGLLTGAVVRIAEPESKLPKATRMIEGTMSEGAAAVSARGGGAGAPPALAIRHEKRDVWAEGEWALFEIVLEDRSGATYDEVKATLAYDPETLEIIDTDEGNLIREGVNVLDGAFAENWGWRDFRANRADEKTGRIVYHAGASRAEPRGSGVLFRAVARVKRPAVEPLLEWVYAPGARPEDDSSGVWLLGRNLYGAPGSAISKETAAGLGEGELRPPPAAGAEKADPAVYRSKRKAR